MQELPRKSRSLDPGPPGLVDDIGLDHQIDVDELGRIGVVGMDAADLGGGQDHMVDFLMAEKIPHRRLTGEIEFGMAAGDDLPAAEVLQLPDDGRTDHAAMSGDIDPAEVDSASGAAGWAFCSGDRHSFSAMQSVHPAISLRYSW